MVKETIIKTVSLNCYFGPLQVLKNLNLEIYKNEIFGIIGPANSGKTTFLRALNRLNYLNTSYSQSGEIFLASQNLKSISDNIAYGPKVHGITDKDTVNQIVEDALKKAYLWDEVKDRLHEPAVKLSGGQQQRLCIARTLAVGPDVVLYDEHCSGLDPISTAKIEDAMQQLKKDYTQILVTNNTKQAARVSERCAFFLMGELIEIGETAALFTNPGDKRTDDYITGRFG
jgi:phosphate transport system ATP-binding protein